MVNKMLKMQLLEDDDELAYAPVSDSNKENKDVDGRPAWMRTLSNSLHTWSQMLPKVSCWCLYSISKMILSKFK